MDNHSSMQWTDLADRQFLFLMKGASIKYQINLNLSVLCFLTAIGISEMIETDCDPLPENK